MDKSRLTNRNIQAKTGEVFIDGEDEPVIVRGLSRWEMIHAQKLENNRHKQEQYLLSVAVLDPAGMTEADVEQWQKSGGFLEIETVAQKINELSGIGKAAAKSDLPGDGD